MFVAWGAVALLYIVGIPIALQKSWDSVERQWNVYAFRNRIYELSIVVDGFHLMIGAVPQDDNSCPRYRFDLNGIPLKKHVACTGTRYSGESLALGTFSLRALEQAYEGATIDENQPYNLLVHNCAELPFQMLDILGIDVTDRKLIKFVSQSLSQVLHEEGHGLRWLRKELERYRKAVPVFDENYVDDRIAEIQAGGATGDAVVHQLVEDLVTMYAQGWKERGDLGIGETVEPNA